VKLEITMPKTTGITAVPAPTHASNEFLAYESECRDSFRPLVSDLLDMAEAAGWSRRTAASTLMYLAAQHISSASGKSATAE
jgi:hypothetical protein